MSRMVKSVLISMLVIFSLGFAFLFIFKFGQAAGPFDNPHGNYTNDTTMCGYCHSGHNSLSFRLLTRSTQRETCYTCHDGSKSNFNVQSQFGEAVVGSSVYSSYHPVPTGVQVCTTCHNPHLASGVKPRLLAVGEAAYSSGNKVCGVCHGTGSTVVGGDMITPITGTPHDVALTNPSSGTEIKCVRCHQPHGSPYKPLIQPNIQDQIGISRIVTGNNNTVCFGCHINEEGYYGGMTVFNGTYHGSKTTSTVALTVYPGTAYAPTHCLNCHEPHGRTGLPDYKRLDGNSLCIKCHDDPGVSGTVYSYRGIDVYNNTPHASTGSIPGSHFYKTDTAGTVAWETSGIVSPTPSSPGNMATTSQTAYASSNDTGYWVTGLAAAEGTYNYQMYKFHITQNITDISRIIPKWIGYGEPTVNYFTDLFIWNQNSLSWVLLDSRQLGTEGTLSGEVTADFTNYIDGSGDLYLLARAKHDGTAPTITSAPAVSNMTGTTGTVSWTTNEPSTSYVEYGLTTGYGNITGDDTLTTSHAVNLTGLTNGQTYNYRVRSKDALGNERVSGNYTFRTSTTPAAPVLIPQPDYNDGLYSINVTLQWNAVTDPDPGDTVQYYVEISNNNFSTIYANSGWINNTTWTRAIGNYNTVTWSWRVKTRDNWGYQSGWSTPTDAFDHVGEPPKDSCPILYTWDGKKFRFNSETNPGSFVGLELAPGKFQKPIFNEQSAIDGSMLAEKDGEYVLKIKNEQDEVDFIDNMALEAIDHPVGSKIAQNDFMRSKGL